MKGGGGRRPGAGRKPRPIPISQHAGSDDPLRFLIDQMNDPGLDARLRIDAAKALMPFVHHKKGEGGKKDERLDAAKKVASGKFGAFAPPRLVSSK